MIAPAKRSPSLMSFFSKRYYGTVIQPIGVLYARSSVAMISSLVMLACQRLLGFTTRQRELIALAASSANGCQFCFDLHGYDGASVIDVGEIHAVSSGDFSSFSQTENALLNAAREWCLGNRSPSIYSRLREHFSDRQVARLVWLVASNVMLNFIGSTLAFRSENLSVVQLPGRDES